MAHYILALDQGTTSSRVLVLQIGSGAPLYVGTTQQEFTQIYPQDGWVEHNPTDIWDSQKNCVVEAIQKFALPVSNILSLGITNQRETTLVWHKKTGKPIYNAIVWQDRRTSTFCMANKDKQDWIQHKTGLLLDPYFSATKIAWILEHVPQARALADQGELAFGTVDAWLLFKLTGEHKTDTTNASRTLLFNIHTQTWDPELLEFFNIPASLLPTIQGSSSYFGSTTVFGGSISINAMIGDQQAATFGQGCFEVGMAKSTYGTGCFMLMNTGAKAIMSKHQLVTTIAWSGSTLPTQYALEGSVFMAGALIQWLRDQLQLIATSDDVETLASSVASTEGVYFVPAFTGLGCPYWDPYARGTLLGLHRGSSKGHIARAALEAITFQTTDLLQSMQQDSQLPLHSLRVDGGASRNNLLMQMQADILGTQVVRPKITETTALGAAYLAGLQTQIWHDLQDIRSFWEIDRVFEPSITEELRQSKIYKWNKALDRSKLWATE
jgi:glycerol kinase